MLQNTVRVAKIISAMVNKPRFAEAIQAKIGTAVDTAALEQQVEVLQGRLKQTLGAKTRLERQMDTLDIGDPHYDRKISDLQRRYDEQYDIMVEIESQIDELQSQIRSIRQEKISGDNIYRLLLAFDAVYSSATEAERKELMKAFIERIDLYPEKRKDGCWIRSIVFIFPMPVEGGEVKELSLESETTVNTMLCTLLVVPPTIKKAWEAPKASTASSSASRITETGWHRLSRGFMLLTSTSMHCCPRKFVNSGLPLPCLWPGTSKGTTRIF